MQLPELAEETVRGINPLREQWVPYESPVQTELLGIIGDRLRPPQSLHAEPHRAR